MSPRQRAAMRESVEADLFRDDNANDLHEQSPNSARDSLLRTYPKNLSRSNSFNCGADKQTHTRNTLLKKSRNKYKVCLCGCVFLFSLFRSTDLVVCINVYLA